MFGGRHGNLILLLGFGKKSPMAARKAVGRFLQKYGIDKEPGGVASIAKVKRALEPKPK
jgi:hypothetical protein